MAWRCRFLTARRSPHGRVVAENAPDTLVDVHTGLDAKLTGPVAERALAQTQQLAALGNERGGQSCAGKGCLGFACCVQDWGEEPPEAAPTEGVMREDPNYQGRSQLTMHIGTLF